MARSYRDRDHGGRKARERFCIECGARDLPGPFRYDKLGYISPEEGRNKVWWVRCERCEKAAKLSEEQLFRDVCGPCYEEEEATRQANLGGLS